MSKYEKIPSPFKDYPGFLRKSIRWAAREEYRREHAKEMALLDEIGKIQDEEDIVLKALSKKSKKRLKNATQQLSLTIRLHEVCSQEEAERIQAEIEQLKEESQKLSKDYQELELKLQPYEEKLQPLREKLEELKEPERRL